MKGKFWNWIFSKSLAGENRSSNIPICSNWHKCNLAFPWPMQDFCHIGLIHTSASWCMWKLESWEFTLSPDPFDSGATQSWVTRVPSARRMMYLEGTCALAKPGGKWGQPSLPAQILRGVLNRNCSTGRRPWASCYGELLALLQRLIFKISVEINHLEL